MKNEILKKYIEKCKTSIIEDKFFEEFKNLSFDDKFSFITKLRNKNSLLILLHVFLGAIIGIFIGHCLMNIIVGRPYLLFLNYTLVSTAVFIVSGYFLYKKIIFNTVKIDILRNETIISQNH